MGDQSPIFRSPIDDPGLTDHIISRQKRPVVRIAGIVAVVAQNEVTIFRHIPGPVIRRIGVDVRLVEQSAVDAHLAFANLDMVAGHAHHALDEITATVIGKMQDDDVTPLGIIQIIAELIDNNVFAFLEGGQHAVTLNSEPAGSRIDDPEDKHGRNRRETDKTEDVRDDGAQRAYVRDASYKFE